MGTNTVCYVDKNTLCFWRRHGLAGVWKHLDEGWPKATQINTDFRRQNAGVALRCGAEWREGPHFEMGHAGAASLGLDPCTLRRQGTVHQGTLSLRPCGPTCTTNSSPSLILPPGLPALEANDPEGKSDCTLLPVPPQNSPPETPTSQLFSWIHVLFFFPFR